MNARRIITIAAWLAASTLGATARAQQPADEAGTLPIEISPEKTAALQSLSPALPTAQTARARRPHRYFFRPLHHPLTPRDVALRESVRALGTDNHHFVRCELKNRTVVTGAITSIGNEEFFVRTGILETSGSTISYRELNAPPQHVAAVGEHVKNGLEWTGMGVLFVAAIPLAVVFYPLVAAGVIQD